MENTPTPRTLTGEYDENRNKGIEVDEIRQIKEHVGEVFISKEINVPEEKIRSYLDAVGDINPIHFNPERINESIFARRSGGKIIVPGMFVQSLWSHRDVIYSALKIKEDYEVMLPTILGPTDFKFPIFADSNIVFRLELEKAEDQPIQSRYGVKTTWNIVAYSEIGSKMHQIMTTRVVLNYVALKSNTESPE
jgi:acyl dehydratase